MIWQIRRADDLPAPSARGSPVGGRCASRCPDVVGTENPVTLPAILSALLILAAILVLDVLHVLTTATRRKHA